MRPAKCYRWDSPAYTRVSNNPADSFVTGIPVSRIIHYDMGNLTGEFELEFSIVSHERIMVRHNALEAARVMIHKFLTKSIGAINYRLKVRVYPHHIMRENVMATGAGADRVQDGMRRAFGKPIGRTARINKNQPIISVYVDKDDARIKKVRDVLQAAMKKLPGDMHITVSKSTLKPAVSSTKKPPKIAAYTEEAPPTAGVKEEKKEEKKEEEKREEKKEGEKKEEKKGGDKKK